MKFLDARLGSAFKRSRSSLQVLHLRLLQSSYGEHAIPFGYWLIVRSLIKLISQSPDPLSPPYGLLQSRGKSLQVPELQELLWKDELGTWALDNGTIELLWKKIQWDRPKTVIECGVGVSTLILARYATSCYSKSTNSYGIFSLEQDAQIKQEVERRLAKHGLGDSVRIIHSPISEQGRYELDANKLSEQLGSNKADWLLIDGPAGPEGCREWTLPLLARFCKSGARWFLDDAFRDAELRILGRWLRQPGIIVEGIYPVGKGLATGTVNNPQEVTLL